MSNSILQAFKGLNVAAATEISQHENIYEVLYEYLSKIKDYNDAKLFHNCVVALINLDRYHKALELIKKVPAEVHDSFPLEKAYVYYKTNHTALLVELYEGFPRDTHLLQLRALKHIVAQAYYQNGQVSQSLALYHDLIETNANIDRNLDLLCNERAVVSQFSDRRSVFEDSASEDNYDVLFNTALIELAHGDRERALLLLEDAAEKCAAQNMDSSEEDVLVELAPIKLTTAYIYQATERKDEARAILASLAGISDLMILLLVKNNLASLSETQANQNLVHRDLDYEYTFHHLQQKLTRAQFRTLLKNHLLLSYNTNTLSLSSSYLSPKFLSQYVADFAGDYTLYIYKVLVRLDITVSDLDDLNCSRAIARKIAKYIRLEKDSRAVVAAALLLVSVNHKTGNFSQALPVLQKVVDENELTPGLVAVLVLLYESLNMAKGLDELLDRLTLRIENLGSELANETVYNFARVLGFKNYSLGKTENANRIFDVLQKANKEDILIQNVVNSSAEGLLSVDALTAETKPVEDLLAVNLDLLVPRAIPVSKTRASRAAKAQKVAKKARKPTFSKTKVVKPAADFNPDDLDKERWLPLKLRSYYKPSKKELKKKAAGGHQGALEPEKAITPTPSSAASKKKKKKGKK